MIDLRMFCAEENNTRYCITVPFQQNRYHYATNGHWAARRKSSNPLPLPPLSPPPMLDLDWRAKFCVTPLPFKKLPPLQRLVPWPEPRCVVWPNAMILEIYARQLLAIGAKIYARKDGRAGKAIRFSVEDVEGLLMPVDVLTDDDASKIITMDKRGIGHVPRKKSP